MEIVIIGSGNLATQLSLALSEAGHHIGQVYSRMEAHASELAAKLGCRYTTDINQISAEAEIYIISLGLPVSDWMMDASVMTSSIVMPIFLARA